MKEKDILKYFFVICLIAGLSFVLINSLRSNNRLEVTDSNPSNNSQGNQINIEPEIFFNRKIDDINNLFFSIQPNLSFEYEKTSEKSVKIYTDFWNPSTIYKIYIYSDSQLIETINIGTKSIQNLEDSELSLLNNFGIQQIYSVYGQASQQNPWIESLPIIKEFYTISYDIRSDELIAIIKDINNLPQERRDEIEQEIITDIRNIGVAEDYPFQIY